MAEQLREALDALPSGPEAIFEPAPHGTRLALVREAVGRLVWGTMDYACDACGFRWAVWMSLGVEGPPALRESGLYVAAPFTIGCPALALDANL